MFWTAPRDAWSYGRRAAALALSAAILTGCSAPASGPPSALPETGTTPAPITSAEATPTITDTVTDTAAPLARGLEPVALTIDAIGLSEPLIDLGLTAEGSMEVPADFDDVGWFTGGGRPGGHGPLVIAAHVDSPTGPAAFIRLRDLAVGDVVSVTDSAGTVHRYRVSEVADYPKADFPTARVFGAVATDEVRLITCGGIFDSSAGSYEDNRVLYGVRESP